MISNWYKYRIQNIALILVLSTITPCFALAGSVSTGLQLRLNELPVGENLPVIVNLKNSVDLSVFTSGGPW